MFQYEIGHLTFQFEIRVSTRVSCFEDPRTFCVGFTTILLPFSGPMNFAQTKRIGPGYTEESLTATRDCAMLDFLLAFPYSIYIDGLVLCSQCIICDQICTHF